MPQSLTRVVAILSYTAFGFTGSSCLTKNSITYIRLKEVFQAPRPLQGEVCADPGAAGQLSFSKQLSLHF